MHRIFSYRSVLVATAIALAPLAVNAQATAAVTCKDGTTSAATGRGACSGHGGVDKAAKTTAKASAKVAKTEAKADTKVAKQEAKVAARETKAAAKSTSADVKQAAKIPNATAANTDPTNATAKCKDGTYSHAASRRGACSRHGGVAEWLKS